MGCGKFLSDFAGAGTFATAGLADIVKPYASISDVYEYSRFVRKTYGIDGSENKKRGRSKDRP